MKKSLIFIFLIIILASKIQAQDLKGKVSIGVGFSFPYIDVNTYIEGVNRWYTLSKPNIGYFVNNSWQLGIRASLNNRQYSDENMPTSDQGISRHWQAELLSTHYKWLNTKWAFFAEHSVCYGYGYNKNNSNYSTQTIRNHETDMHKVELNTRVGAMFMVNKRFGVNISSKIFNLSYSKINRTGNNIDLVDRSSYNVEEVNLTASFLTGNNLSFLNQLQLGLRYFL